MNSCCFEGNLNSSGSSSEPNLQLESWTCWIRSAGFCRTSLVIRTWTLDPNKAVEKWTRFFGITESLVLDSRKVKKENKKKCFCWGLVGTNIYSAASGPVGPVLTCIKMNSSGRVSIWIRLEYLRLFLQTWNRLKTGNLVTKWGFGDGKKINKKSQLIVAFS